MKQVLIRNGKAVIEEIPAPCIEPGTVLVQVDHSCISIGTEMSGVRASGLPLWRRGLQQPEKVRKVIEMVANQGIGKTRRLIEGKLASGAATGYSAAGIVVAVGYGIDDLRQGDRVACSGNLCAHHAEVIRVPRNLTVPIPAGVDFALASTVTLGAIAMQGVRRAQPTLGEAFVVLGLGILGQLTVQFLKANGCRVIGVDVDRRRINLAQEVGIDAGIHPDDGSDIDQVARLTDGIGADGVIITAATPSDAVISTAFKMCRKKGRVVLVGDVGLNLNRADFYQKELDFFISTSYGPGRYDNRYEQEGLDYPVAYVRWTENRNMAEYLRLVAEGKVRLDSLIGKVFTIGKAEEAYELLKSGEEKPLMVLLSYPRQTEGEPVRVVKNPLARPGLNDRIRLALVGAGGFARGMHLPNLQTMTDRYHLQAVMSRTGHNADAAAKQFGANYAATDYEHIIGDPEVDAVLIATRHDLHAEMALAALRAGKHVLLEKPLALFRHEMRMIEDFFEEYTGTEPPPMLLTGFNRRFSGIARRIKGLTEGRSNPMIINYRMNAGYIHLDNWVHTKEGGGRNKGEACHIYDLFTYLTGSRVNSVHAVALKPTTGHYTASDNFVATITFEDGSLATLTYTALGCKEFPKEQLDIYFDGKVLTMDDYRKLSVFGAKSPSLENRVSDKGQKDELEAFASAIQGGGEWPIPLWQQIQAMEIAFQVETALGGVV